MGVITGTAVAVLGVVGAALSRLLTDDFKASLPRITEHLLERAVRKLPEVQRQRFAEEWRGHLNDVPGDLSKLFVASSLLYGAAEVACEIVTAVQEREAELVQIDNLIKKLEGGVLTFNDLIECCNDLDSVASKIEADKLRSNSGSLHETSTSLRAYADCRIHSYNVAIQKPADLSRRCHIGEVPRPISEEHDIQHEIDWLAAYLSHTRYIGVPINALAHTMQ